MTGAVGCLGLGPPKARHGAPPGCRLRRSGRDRARVVRGTDPTSPACAS